jgi:hypothetical protein
MAAEIIIRTVPVLTADDIIALAAELNRLGFSIDIHHHLDALIALDTVFARKACDSPIDGSTVSNVLSPIFCSSPAEQVSFREVFSQWLKNRTETTARMEQSSDKSIQSKEKSYTKRHLSKATIRLLSTAGIMIVLIVVGLLSKYLNNGKRVVPLSGKVIDRTTGSPIPGAIVKWKDSIDIGKIENHALEEFNLSRSSQKGNIWTDSAVSDSLGRFKLNIPPNGGVISTLPPHGYLKPVLLSLKPLSNDIFIILTRDPGPQVLHGRVYAPLLGWISGAMVSFEPTRESVITDYYGKFSLFYQPKADTGKLDVTAEGFLAVSLQVPSDGSATDTLSISMEDKPPAEVDSLNALIRRINYLANQRSTVYDSQFLIKYRRLMTAAAFAIPLLLFLIWFLIGYLRRKALFRKRSTAYTPEIKSAFVKGISSLLFRGPFFRKLMQEYRRRAIDGEPYLDTAKSIDYAVNRCGLFVPVYTHRHTLPEYLIFIDRKDLNDQYAKYIDELVGAMRWHDIAIEIFYFDGSPRYLRNAEGKAAWHTITQLVDRFPRHRLMIFSDCSGFFNRLTGNPHPWIDDIFPWQQRGIFLPETTRHAAIIERIFKEKGFNVQPAHLAGLRQQINKLLNYTTTNTTWENKRQLPAFLAEHEEIYNDHLAPEPAILKRILDELKEYLDENGMYLLGACAIYPELRYELTFYLAAVLTIGNTGEMNEDQQRTVQSLVADITCLSWFSKGSMPDWLRLQLIAQLSPRQHAKVRRILFDLVISAKKEKTMLRPEDTIEISAAQYRFTYSLEEIKTSLIRIMGKSPDDPMRDYVFATYISGPNPGVLSMLIPQATKKLFFRSGNMQLGWRPSIALAMTIAIIVLGLERLTMLPHSLELQFTYPEFSPAVYSHKYWIHYPKSKKSASFYITQYLKKSQTASGKYLSSQGTQAYLVRLTSLLRQKLSFDTTRYNIVESFDITPFFEIRFLKNMEDLILMRRNSSFNVKGVEKLLSIAGKVVDKMDGSPINAAKVRAVRDSILTRPDGGFSFSNIHGRKGDSIEIEVEAAGFKVYRKSFSISMPIRVEIERGKGKEVQIGRMIMGKMNFKPFNTSQIKPDKLQSQDMQLKKNGLVNVSNIDTVQSVKRNKSPDSSVHPIDSFRFTYDLSLDSVRNKLKVKKDILQNLASLRYEYHNRLRNKPYLEGKIVVKFSIDEMGKVVFCHILASTMNDSIFEAIVVNKIKSWNFDRINKPGDTTEIVYPFNFSETNLSTKQNLKFVQDSPISNLRSNNNILKIIMQNLPTLRYAFNSRLREKPKLSGTIIAKIAIDEFGKVIYTEVVKTTINDSIFETAVVKEIKSWNFGHIDNPGDVTEIEYPFLFTD